MPKTLRQNVHQVSQQVVRLAEANSELTMARESEKSHLGMLMEMMVSMRMDDMKRDDEREETRQREELKREEEQETREERLSATLKAAQPVVSQTVNISKLNLPKMTDKDDTMVFIRYLKTALIRAKVPIDAMSFCDGRGPLQSFQMGEKAQAQIAS